jgi:hypothetical protein
MIGSATGASMDVPLLWVTSDLINWNVEKRLPISAFNVGPLGYQTSIAIGAPKMYYDEDSRQYIITWHSAQNGLSQNGNEEHDKPFWRSLRTFYVLTSDFTTFTSPQRLFYFTGEHTNMPTMDALIRKIDGKYYAFIKDERYSGDIASGYKAIRIAKSDNLTGPYANPGNAVTETRHEGQTLVRNPSNTGWYLWAEHYSQWGYNVWEASTIEGTWTKKEINISDRRHGSMIWIDGDTYNAVVKAYENKKVFNYSVFRMIVTE